MRLAILTSSRADYGIYLPLLHELKNNEIPFEIIAFGTHLSRFHGYTVKEIQKNGFKADHTIDSLLLGDNEEAIASSIGLTMIKFSSFWRENKDRFDLVFCLGDRYEMFAAVMAGIPFNIRFGHLHGGEKTLGAIDNIFRHSISQASSVHFTSTAQYAERLKTLLDVPENIFNVGALSLDNLDNITFFSPEEFRELWGVDFYRETVLMTFHPETVLNSRNGEYARELCKVIQTHENLQFLITMPNADTSGNLVREIFVQELSALPNVIMVENLGSRGYFSAMKYCMCLLGNTSSGILEAASFKKYVIDVGDRQLGRLAADNVIKCEIKEEKIAEALDRVSALKTWEGENIYWNGGATKKILSVLKKVI